MGLRTPVRSDLQDYLRRDYKKPCRRLSKIAEEEKQVLWKSPDALSSFFLKKKKGPVLDEKLKNRLESPFDPWKGPNCNDLQNLGPRSHERLNVC